MRYGIVIKSITDLLAKPHFLSERKSQLLFNEPVVIDHNRDGYTFVIQPDGYTGWIYDKALLILSRKGRDNYLSKLNYRINAKTCGIKSPGPDSKLPQFLFYGTKVRGFKKHNGRLLARDIIGQSFSLSLKNADFLAHINSFNPSRIVAEAKRFLGAPYLWGGISPYGFDCSGYIRMIMRRFNIELPRDSSEQAKVGVRIKFEDIGPADLLFFKGHVAIAINDADFIHASLGEGGVAISSLDPKAKNFRKDLYDTFLHARRVFQ